MELKNIRFKQIILQRIHRNWNRLFFGKGEKAKRILLLGKWIEANILKLFRVKNKELKVIHSEKLTPAAKTYR